MAYDGLIVKSIVYELNKNIIDGKINKIFEPNKNEILLGIYANGKNYAINICIDSSNYRLHLTTHSKPNPINAPNFCMLLRKYLIGMKIKSIYTTGLERCVTFILEGYNEMNDLITRKLIVELMGKHSNIILLNDKDIIIDSLRHLDTSFNSNRNIAPACPYCEPPDTKHDFLKLQNFEEFYNILTKSSSTDNLSKCISSTFTGISKNFIDYIIKTKLENNPSFDKQNIEKIYNYIKTIVDNYATDKISCTNFSSNNKSDYVLCFEEKSTPLSINFFIDDFYHEKELDDTLVNYKNSLLRLILNNLNKYKKKLISLDSKIKECSNMDTYKLYGELIIANLYKIPNDNISSIELENYYDNNTLITIPLDKSKNPNLNAKNYYKKYNKLKSTLEYATDQKKEVLKELNYIESIIYELETANTIEDLDEIYSEISNTILAKDRYYNAKKVQVKKKINKKKLKDTTWVPIEYNVDGFSVFVGKNNKQNDYLTCKLAKQNDLWFHTKDIHGSHVILKTQNQEVPIEVIIKCASIAAFYSNAKSSSNVPVDYTFIKNVKKPHGAKPGMVIYTSNSTVNVNPKNILE